jgi:chromosome segregation ATPase
MFLDAEKLQPPREHLSCLQLCMNHHSTNLFRLPYDGPTEKGESKNIKMNSSESEKQALEERFQTDTNQPWDLQKNIASLRFELQALKESNRILEDQIQNDASINTDLTTQLTETELKEAYHKILALEVELKSKYHYCEELDTMC